MANLSKIVDELSKLTVVEAADLSKKLEEKWGVTAAIPAAPTVAAAEAPKEEKTDFVIFLSAVGGKKINVIKEVKKNVPKKEAEEIKKKLEAAGAKVELR